MPSKLPSESKSPLNQIIAYWRDCVHSEDILGKGISPRARKKSVLSPFATDPFIFGKEPHRARASDLEEFSQYAGVQELDCYYGYPTLLYRGEDGTSQLAPLFVVKVRFVRDGKTLQCLTDEVRPECGLQACQELGLRAEDTARLSASIDEIFAGVRGDSKTLLSKVLELFHEDVQLPIRESLDPSHIGQTKLSAAAPLGIYNHSVLFLGENTAFNFQLLQDLRELSGRSDLESTALAVLLGNAQGKENAEIVPILPFPSNENQNAALQQVFANALSVITGPPGTGKSQFISNLIANLFIHGKTALFVSHTNEAVNVVNSRLNSQFPNLMLRTGNKDIRQELKGRLNLLVQSSGRTLKSSISRPELEDEWKKIIQRRMSLLDIDTREARVDRAARDLAGIRELYGSEAQLESVLRSMGPKAEQIQHLSSIIKMLLEKLVGQRFSLWDRTILFFRPGHFQSLLERQFGRLSDVLGAESLALLRRGKSPEPLTGEDDPAWNRVPELVVALKLQKEIIAQHHWLESQPTRRTLEEAILKTESGYYIRCLEYLRVTYHDAVLGQSKLMGKVISFIDAVSGTQSPDQGVTGYLFRDALKVLRVWSCTLKSLRRTFPLVPAAFDYVIFDEASQVDLPSAAPALYRAKQAIIVGDPMQLNHITTLSRAVEEGFAKVNGLMQLPEMYPVRVRYSDISLYRATEASLTVKPVLLSNHYRSEDQIIGLCNRVFYQGQLKILTAIERNRYPPNLPLGVEWIDCKGRTQRLATGSRLNQHEAAQAVEILRSTLIKIDGTDLKIGVVTPYSAQRELIFRLAAREIASEKLEKHDVKILTAHRFQGSERDIMIFSPVLAAQGEWNDDRWFNNHRQILNVALSRAKLLLYIVGDKEFCRSRRGVLGKIVEAFEEIKTEEAAELQLLGGKLDTPYEATLYERLAKSGLESLGYQLIPKLVVKRYTLDIAVVGNRKIDIECDGAQHQLIGGLPVIEDVARDEFLNRHGWEVVRVPNRRIILEVDQVVAEVRALCSRPHDTPLKPRPT